MSTSAAERKTRCLNLHLVEAGTRGTHSAINDDHLRDRRTAVAPAVLAAPRLIVNQLIALLADLREPLDSHARKSVTGQALLASRSLLGSTGEAGGNPR
jgi:hypothetical protein